MESLLGMLNLHYPKLTGMFSKHRCYSPFSLHLWHSYVTFPHFLFVSFLLFQYYLGCLSPSRWRAKPGGNRGGSNRWNNLCSFQISGPFYWLDLSLPVSFFFHLLSDRKIYRSGSDTILLSVYRTVFSHSIWAVFILPSNLPAVIYPLIDVELSNGMAKGMRPKDIAFYQWIAFYMYWYHQNRKINHEFLD